MINSKADLNRAVANALHPKPPASERRAIHESKVWRWICPGDYPPGSDRDALGRFGHWEPADFCGELERVYLAATPGDWSIPHIADDTTKCNCVYVLSEGYAGSVCDISVGDGLSVSEGGNDAPPLEQARANAMFIPMAHNAFPRLLATIRETKEACAKIAEGEMYGRDCAYTRAYNQACWDIAAEIRRAAK